MSVHAERVLPNRVQSSKNQQTYQGGKREGNWGSNGRGKPPVGATKKFEPAKVDKEPDDFPIAKEQDAMEKPTLRRSRTSNFEAQYPPVGYDSYYPAVGQHRYEQARKQVEAERQYKQLLQAQKVQQERRNEMKIRADERQKFEVDKQNFLRFQAQMMHHMPHMQQQVPGPRGFRHGHSRPALQASGYSYRQRPMQVGGYPQQSQTDRRGYHQQLQTDRRGSHQQLQTSHRGYGEQSQLLGIQRHQPENTNVYNNPYVARKEQRRDARIRGMEEELHHMRDQQAWQRYHEEYENWAWNEANRIHRAQQAAYDRRFPLAKYNWVEETPQYQG